MRFYMNLDVVVYTPLPVITLVRGAIHKPDRNYG